MSRSTSARRRSARGRAVGSERMFQPGPSVDVQLLRGRWAGLLSSKMLVMWAKHMTGTQKAVFSFSGQGSQRRQESTCPSRNDFLRSRTSLKLSWDCEMIDGVGESIRKQLFQWPRIPNHKHSCSVAPLCLPLFLVAPLKMVQAPKRVPLFFPGSLNN